MANNTKQDLLQSLERAVVLLDAAERYIRENPIAEHTVVYDEAECDGYCLADDCAAAAIEALGAIARAKGGAK